MDPFLPRQCPLDDPKEAASKDKTGCLSRQRSPCGYIKRVFLVEVTPPEARQSGVLGTDPWDLSLGADLTEAGSLRELS